MVERIIESFLEHSLELVLLFIFGYLATLRKRFVAWLKARTTLQQQEILQRLASDGFALVEQTYKDAEGVDKFNEAFAYAQSRLDRYGIKLDRGAIIAAIEKAVLDYNAKVNSGKDVVK